MRLKDFLNKPIEVLVSELKKYNIGTSSSSSTAPTDAVLVSTNQTIAGQKTFSDPTSFNKTVQLVERLQQTYVDKDTDPIHDGQYSHFTSNNSANPGYNIHAIKDGSGNGGGAVGAANTSTGSGAAVVGNRYGDGSGEGGSFVRIGNGAGDAVLATQNSTGAGNGIQGIKGGASAGHGMIGVQAGTGPGHGVVGDVQTPTAGHGVYAVVEGGGSGDALRAFNVNGSGYSGQFIGGKGVRVQAVDPVANGPVKDTFVLGNSVVANDDYSLKLGVSFDGGGLSHFIRHYFGGSVRQQIHFDHATHIRLGLNGNNTISVIETGVILHTTVQPPVPPAGTIVEWFDGTDKKWMKSDGTIGSYTAFSDQEITQLKALLQVNNPSGT